jgi:RES domain-containing protein
VFEFFVIAAMASVDLTPRQARKAYGGDGGTYYEWSPADLPMLEHANIGGAKLSLNAGGLALPSFSDSGKVAYVLQGILTSIAQTLYPHR